MDFHRYRALTGSRILDFGMTKPCMASPSFADEALCGSWVHRATVQTASNVRAAPDSKGRSRSGGSSSPEAHCPEFEPSVLQ